MSETAVMTLERGDTLEINNLGERKVRKAIKEGVCNGWPGAKRQPYHQIERGQLYIETEFNFQTRGMFRCCLNCARMGGSIK